MHFDRLSVEGGVCDLELVVVLVAVVDLHLGLVELHAVRVEVHLLAVGVPVLLAGVEDCWRVNLSVHDEFTLKSPSHSVEVEFGELALRVLQVGARKSFYLPLLEAAVIVVEAFSARARSRGQVFEELELPVGPADKELVSDAGHLLDLLGAGALRETGTKLSYHVGDAEPLGVLVTRRDSLVVEAVALGLHVD